MSPETTVLSRPLWGHVADIAAAGSLASKARRRRFEFFLSLLKELPRPLRILDVGGRQKFWDRMKFAEPDGVRIVLLNLQSEPVSRGDMSSVVGDARDLSRYADGEFECVFSNSVIGHVGDSDSQKQMATEVQRVGQSFFVQSPNRAFPIDPNFTFPLFQFLPRSVRIGLVARFNLGHMPRVPEPAAAAALLDSIRLLDRRQMQRLFPDSRIYEERYCGMVKSFAAYGGTILGGPARPKPPPESHPTQPG